MALAQSFLDELIYRSDIVEIISRYLPLQRAGTGYKGLCPFHNEKTPSFSVSREKQFFHCFGCGEGGNVLTFIMKIENLSFIDAVKFLADIVGMTVPEDEGSDEVRKNRERLLALNRDTARYFHEMLMSDKGREAREYLAKRGVSQKIIVAFGIGYADDSWDGLLNAMVAKGYTVRELEDGRLISRGQQGGAYCFFRDRLMFPIIDVRGSVIAFGGRVLKGDGGGRKYMNSPDTPVYNKSRTLYGLNLAKKSKAGKLILAEGNMDVLALHQAGFDCAVATCGTALTSEQAKLMSRYATEVVICYDADGAGQTATKKAIDILNRVGINVRVLRLPPRRDEQGKLVFDEKGRPLKDDPDDFIKRNGAEAFAKLLAAPQTDNEYRIGEIKAKYELSSDEQKLAYIKEAVEYIGTMKSAVNRELFSRNVSKETGVSADAILAEIKRFGASKQKSIDRDTEKQAMNPARAMQPGTRDMKYKNPVSAICEERVLSLVLGDHGLLEQAEARISPEEFSSEVLGAIYAKALERMNGGMEPSAAACMASLTEAELKHLTGILGKDIRSLNPKKELLDCIEKIKFENIKNTADDDDALLEMIKHRRGEKG